MFPFRGHFRITCLTILKPFSHTCQAQERSYFPELLCSFPRKNTPMSHLFRPGLLGVCFLALCAVPAGAVVNTTGKICQWGCWDEEDEACHRGLNAAWMPSTGHPGKTGKTPQTWHEKWNDGCEDRCPKKKPYFSLLK